jgi:hypothetical protein
MGQDGLPVSRKGLTYRNTAVQQMFGQLDFLSDMDGELCVGPPWAKDVFNRTQNCVNSGSSAAAAEWERYGKFHVFDQFGVGTFEHRTQTLNRRISGYSTVKMVRQVLLRNRAQLEAYEAKCVAKGYEGVMLRRVRLAAAGLEVGAYIQKTDKAGKLIKDNRSTLGEFFLVKLKRFDYGEAVIKQVFFLQHNHNEEKTATGKRRTTKEYIVTDSTQIGSVALQDGKFKFTVNVQTNELRQKGLAWWQRQIGHKVRYKHQSVGRLEAPRFPQCTFEELS